MVGSAHSNCSSHVCTFNIAAKSNLLICICAVAQSNCFALEQHLCWFDSMGNFGAGLIDFLFTISSGFQVGNFRLPLAVHTFGRASQ